MQLEQAVARAGIRFEQPQPINCLLPADDGEPVGLLQVVCVKYGTKYGADYVNKLYYGVKHNLTTPHDFTCFTDDPAGLDGEIKVRSLANKWTGWWSKVHIFDKAAYNGINLVLYIDLDMIITGSLDELV